MKYSRTILILELKTNFIDIRYSATHQNYPYKLISFFYKTDLS